MKNVILTIILILSLVLVTGCQQAAQQPGTTAVESKANENKISINNFAFEPATINVKLGDTVTWENFDQAPHIISAETFTSDSLGKGDKFQYQFNTKGTYPYHCSIHPSMTGEVVVQ